MLAGLVSAGISIAEFLRSSAGHTVFDLPSRWIKTYDVCMIVTNLYCTFAISWKVYSTARYQSMAEETWRVFAAVVETGLFYTAALITFLGTYLAASNAQYIVVDTVVPIVPCIFCMMILLIHFRTARHISTPEDTRSTLHAGQIQLTTIIDDRWDENSRGRETDKDRSVAAGSETA
ncbi:hypothetical protein EWM64_g3615 [Hericium alpestre]|uniref:Uncharacterized protein n=1 Tax=Hericium alpestre TaxID=135208 RepID=A0A4Y9ZZU8_9AGAM|nr:hypothetical protein EWM64_g3615 [Hericium alpestre]